MASNWIAGATKNKGGLHRSLGVPQGQKIPAGRIAAAAKLGGKVGAQARLAQTLMGMRGGDSENEPKKDRETGPGESIVTAAAKAPRRKKKT